MLSRESEVECKGKLTIDMRNMSIKKPTKSYQQMVAEWKEAPEFVAAYDELETETAELRKGLQSHHKSGLIQFFRQSQLHDV